MSSITTEMNGTLSPMSATKADPYQDEAFNQPHDPTCFVMMEHPNIVPEAGICIDDCQDCHRTCLNEAMNHCLEAGGTHVELHHFRMMMSCAEICQTTANFMLMNSPLHATVRAACAPRARRSVRLARSRAMPSRAWSSAPRSAASVPIRAT